MRLNFSIRMPAGNSEMPKTELMSPAGFWPQLQTAIEAGADAVYFGLNHFSARGKVGFALTELPDVMQTLHQRGVKGYVTFNTLVFDHELEMAEAAIREIADAGADAVIVQDLGMAKLIRQIAPQLTIHGSTQMSITSAQGAELARSFGCQRVVLGRELSLTDIRKIKGATDVELEVFVHGALCVSYSGQCFSSEAWGGRSANRGQCAQACRLSYDLIVDDQPRDLGPYRYLLSPGDLYALEQVKELVELGIACLKIEGRYKDSDYVALTTQAYREAIDLASLGLAKQPELAEKQALEQLYSRGMGPYFIAGINHQAVVQGRAPRHRGMKVGEVFSVGNHSVHVLYTESIKPGDGLVFDAADWRTPDEPEEGGNVYEVLSRGTQLVELKFGRGEIDFRRVRAGDWVWRTRDPQLGKQLKSLTRTEVPRTTQPVRFSVEAALGQPLRITAWIVPRGWQESNLTGTSGDVPSPPGTVANYAGIEPLTEAANRPLDLETLREKLGRLGGTPYHLADLQLLTGDPVFVRSSELNEARRQLVDQLFELSGRAVAIPNRPIVREVVAGLRQRVLDQSRPDSPAPASSLHILVRNGDQLEALLEVSRTIPLASVTLDYLELYGLRPSVEKIRAAGLRPRVASPRILKPSEQNVVQFLISLDCDLLVRTGGLLAPEGGLSIAPGAPPLADNVQLIGDFSLNAANAVSCGIFLDLGCRRITPTYDLNAQQVADLTLAVPAAALEVIAYSHLPIFHTEHCIFCRFLSEGTDSTNCGHPCEKHRVAVRDATGRVHPVMADVGCRNTVFNAQAQVDTQAIRSWQKRGIEHFRMEFVHQTKNQITPLVEGFYDFLNGNLPPNTLAKILQAHSPQEITTGSLYVPKDFQKLVQLG
jgi:putative protease